MKKSAWCTGHSTRDQYAPRHIGKARRWSSRNIKIKSIVRGSVASACHRTGRVWGLRNTSQHLHLVAPLMSPLCTIKNDSVGGKSPDHKQSGVAEYLT